MSQLFDVVVLWCRLGWTSCDAGSECYCAMPFFFDFLCLSYGCQADPDAPAQ